LPISPERRTTLLSSCAILNTSSANAFEHIENIKKQKSWSDDSEALQSLKRYITNKFS
jgi:hypothetical protein